MSISRKEMPSILFGVTVGAGSKRVKGVRRQREAGARYARYTEQQIEVLEKLYAECSSPNHFQRAQIIREEPTLRNIDNKQLKVWFQNRRCREKQRKENCDLASENRRLTAANKMLRQENDGLQKKLAQLICENEHLRNQVLNLTTTITTYDLVHQPETNNPQMPIRIANSNNGLLSLAEETKKEFLSKAVGTAINWIPVPWLKLRNPGSLGTIYVSSSCIGVAARAFATVPFKPIKTIELLKDRPSWSRRCRNIDVIAKYPANNGGTIELIYTQYYAPIIMACARDFWTLRYTCMLGDGSYVVCEKSISGSDAAPSSPAALEFVRGRMMASGYLVRPRDDGSTVYLVDHMDLEASSIPEVARPLYESSELVAKKMIVSALHYIEHVANEANDKQTHAYQENPAFLRSFSQRLSRGFNDAVNCFSEDGWTLMNGDASDDVIMSIKRTTIFGAYTTSDTVICVKASCLLHNIVPASMVQLLKERRSAWMDFDFSDHSVAFTKAACFSYPGHNTHNLSGAPVLLGHNNHEDEALEVIRFDRSADLLLTVSSGDIYHLQMSNGMEDNGFGACSELIFAPVDRTIPDDAVLFASGFRIYLLGSHTDTNSSTDLTSNEASNTRNGAQAPSMLIVAFQFPFEAHLQEEVVAMAQQYIRHVISSVKKISMEIMTPGSNPEMNSTEANPAAEFNNISSESTYAVNLATLICQSYRSSLGVDILGFNSQSTDSAFEQIQFHPYAIICFSYTAAPVCLYSNQAGLTMLETHSDNLQNLTVDRVLGGSNNISLYSMLPTINQQGYAILPPGQCLSVMDRCVSYGQAVVWRVHAPDGSIHCLAMAFVDWSSIQEI
ncbi:hypothetical protein ABFS82_06G168400 [Erythranthe guttata]|uniref:homeobox-leucine zipper protein REVOLUTA-like isoform X4 n=1 Tax=Erythranthe guttata TaxID=4155 RepID=UPI00064D84CB|nr:PREDICTED: homeobox-leucine zipper protein REVOLUTA-like isoform X4 [Erythranthe guttata]|eukprot:XP_012834934.1 PREDICTED: homeobox-leucine zipper protein REVOLUTA-like isoform X4 [Erythranthe guttata]